MNAKQALEQSTKNREALLTKGISEGMKQFQNALGRAVEEGDYTTVILLQRGSPTLDAIRSEVKNLIASEGFSVCDADDDRIEISWQVAR